MKKRLTDKQQKERDVSQRAEVVGHPHGTSGSLLVPKTLQLQALETKTQRFDEEPTSSSTPSTRVTGNNRSRIMKHGTRGRQRSQRWLPVLET